MTHLIPELPATNSSRNTIARTLFRGTLSFLKRIKPFPAALAKGVADLSGTVGSAAGMAYFDPFLPNRKNRR